MKFLADPSLGKLAKWLRVLGYDTLYYRRANPEVLIDTARREERVLLTRDTHLRKNLVSTGFAHLFIQSDHLPEQLRQTNHAFSVWRDARPFTRCLACNEELQGALKPTVEKRVPEFVYETQQDFVECPGCHKVYWPGTHRRRMAEKVRAWLAPSSPAG